MRKVNKFFDQNLVVNPTGIVTENHGRNLHVLHFQLETNFHFDILT